ncbi:unnamed protein product [Orchesella dallaii]|uniref:Uncharacterized protein n=1 Tax=Orchesella dallaii TaxID=48710 RepID=A0ABP1PS72_9HEXA
MARTIFMAAHAVGYVVFMLPTHILVVYKANDFQMLAYMIVVWLCSFMSVVVTGNLLTNIEGICHLWNGNFSFQRNFAEKFMPAYNPSAYPTNKILRAFLALELFLCAAAGILISVHSILFPDTAPYMLFTVPPQLIFLPMRLYTAFFFSVSAIGTTALLALYIAQGLEFFFIAFPLLSKELKMGLKKYETCDKLRTIKNLVIAYRSLTVLMAHFNHSFCGVIMPFELIFGNLTIFCNVTAALFWEKLDTSTTKPCLMIVAAFSMSGFACFLSLGGLLHVQSGKTIKSWRLGFWNGKFDRMYMKRVKRSCTHIQVNSWGCLKVKPLTALKYVNSSSKGTFRAILMLRKAFMKKI